MFGKQFQLNENTIPIVEEIGRHMPGGFFIYRAEEPCRLLYANEAVFSIFGCKDLAEFQTLTDFTFPGMVHPEDYPAVSEVISKAALSSSDQMDYVEYRIIRRDGAVRWVEDYGHATMTEAYGGIYYVFISDITEKREQMETDKAVRQAVIEALSEAYHTVWLINDVETESFSLYRGDTAGTTIHGLPIREALSRMKYSQAKVYYINTTVAPVDQERLQKELTMENIVRRLQIKPQFNINYLRTMSDGSERYFRIEFAKVNMPNGKMGVVCGFKDVDDDVREGQRMQRTLREKEEAQAEQNKLITALASDYWSVYYIDLDKDAGVCYQSHPVARGLKAGEHFIYTEAFAAYASTYIPDSYREEFMNFISPEAVREALKSERVISFRYMVRRGSTEAFEMIKFAGVRHPENREDHLVHAVGCCITDVDAETRRALAESEALTEALSAARGANVAKTAFLSNMSHEIRTPMNAIIGLNNIALGDPETPPKTREYLEKIGTSAQHLLNIINDILDMSRIESGKMLIKNEEFSFSKLLEQVNTIISTQCRDKALSYECRTIGKLDEYYIGDEVKLKQVLINILGNAVKFTNPGGRVSFTVEPLNVFEDKVSIRFVISDTGIGMSRDYLPRIFDSFSQEDMSSTNRYGSTGLGMPITRSIVELMNGSIEVESEKGVGSTFTVTVTLGSVDMRERAADADSPPQRGKVTAIDDDPAPGGQAEKSLKGKRVLLAEDVLINAEILLIILQSLEMEAELAENGRIALDLFASRPEYYYDAILMDMRMPEMDGLTASRHIRALNREDAKTIPIIALTANAFDEDVQRSMQAGLNAHLSKPVNPEVLTETLRNLI